MAEAQMELRQWECSGDKSSEKTTSVLGLKWDKEEDTLHCDIIAGEIPENITKRVVLSQVRKIFDPLGFLCPAVLGPKWLLQRSWTDKVNWDESLPEAMKSEFQK